MKRYLPILIAMTTACGGAQTTTTTTTSSAPRIVGVCSTPALGVCQIYYEGEAGLDGAQDACTNSQVPGTSGTWLASCPTEARLGDCADATGVVQARFYSGSTQYPDAASAENACEADSGTWVP